MTWQFPTLMALQTTDKLKERVTASSLEGPIPEHVLHRNIETSNPFSEAYWFQEQASAFAGDIDSLYMDIFWISLAFFVVIVAFMVYFCFKYRRKDGVIDPQPSSSHNTTIEILWSVLPSILLVYMFVEGANTFWEMKVPKTNSEEIQVVAYKYGWQFIYPNGDTTSELHLGTRPTGCFENAIQGRAAQLLRLCVPPETRHRSRVVTPLPTLNPPRPASIACRATSTAVRATAR